MFAEKVGATQKTVSRWENGHMVPTVERAQELDELLDTPGQAVDAVLRDRGAIGLTPPRATGDLTISAEGKLLEIQRKYPEQADAIERLMDAILKGDKE